MTSSATQGKIGTTSDNGSMPFSIMTNSQDQIFVEVGGDVGIGTITPGFKLQVGNAGDGTEARANAFTVLSDENLKKNFKPVDNSLRKISSLNGYTYQWKNSDDKKKKLGLKAQEVQKVFPEVISKGEDGFLSVSYDHLVAPIIEAVKELSARDDKRIKKLEVENARLRKQNEELDRRLSKLEKSR